MSQLLSPEAVTFLIAMAPIAELRGAIPLALWFYKLSPVAAYTYAVLGNILVVALLLWWLEPVSNYLSKHFTVCNKFFKWLFARTRKKTLRHFEVWGALALVVFVAVPLPMTGAWTGTIAAFVFGVESKKAFGLISFGVLIAGLIVTLASLGMLAL